MKERVLISALVFLPVFVAIVPMAQAETTITLYPTDDACVINDTMANFNYDDVGVHCLAFAGVPYQIIRTYIKFDLSSIPYPSDWICGARLKLYTTEIDPAGVSLNVEARTAADGWKENTITWNNAPPYGMLITTTPVITLGAWYTWDGPAMKSYIQGTWDISPRVVCFCMKLQPEDTTRNTLHHRDFEDRENFFGTGNGPKLEIDFHIPPLEVGGIIKPINIDRSMEFYLVAPWIGLASLLISTLAVLVVYVKGRKKKQ